MSEPFDLLSRKDATETCKDEEANLIGSQKTVKGNRSFSWNDPFRLGPKFHRVSKRFRKMSCVSKTEDEDMPIEVPRHKSIDIGVGLARRVSLFIFTKRSVCLHPYHPYTPKQTTRKIFLRNDEKQKH
ncbi:unnamed protein product [Pieris macdunnoughi]|uniref:Uncharacterized protein n=1 Tax=Pieris macdunnoughi TaxID=345717 RepID=A0A821QQN8_9NEOP|nr:unnamed protein product [Pieris macdunnoughi]